MHCRPDWTKPGECGRDAGPDRSGGLSPDRARCSVLALSDDGVRASRGINGTEVSSDDELAGALTAAIVGDEAGFAALWRSLQPAVLRYLRVVAGDSAEDVASETWLQAARDLHRFDGRAGGVSRVAVPDRPAPRHRRTPAGRPAAGGAGRLGRRPRAPRCATPLPRSSSSRTPAGRCDSSRPCRRTRPKR